jgi:hypothetical protein
MTNIRSIWVGVSVRKVKGKNNNNPRQTFEVHLHDLTIGVWYTLCKVPSRGWRRDDVGVQLST